MSDYSPFQAPGTDSADAVAADLYSVAADWHERMDDTKASRSERARFDAWLAADSRHASAFEAMDRIWDAMGKARHEPRIMELRREALCATANTGRRWYGWAAAASIVALIGATLLISPRLGERVLSADASFAGRKSDNGAFTTAVGEQATITLSDGSTVVLDTHSRVDVNYSRGQRRVRLLGGQAWFQVARDAVRPFVVDAGNQRITALGTAFNVRLGGSEKTVQVTLVEGKVAVDPIQSTLTRMIFQPLTSVLTPGDSLVVADAKSTITHKADISKIGSWREGRLVFNDETLTEAIEEVNRYSTTQIVLSDPALAGLRVSGVFKAGHSQSFLETVTGHYPIASAEQPDGRVLLTLSTKNPKAH